MTTTIYAFVSNSAAKDNAKSTTSAVGELSGYCRTFSPDVREYATAAYPDIELQLFSSTDTSGYKDPTLAQTNRLLEIGNWVYELGIAMLPSYTQNDFAIAFQTRFANYVSEVVVGKFISGGSFLVPRSLQFTLTTQGNETAIVKLWFANEVFETDYALYTIRVSPPIAALDDLFKPFSTVQNIASQIDVQKSMENVELLKSKSPNTKTVAVTLKWVDPSNANNTVPFTWYAVIYGEAGNTTDNINFAIRDFILANSTNSVDSWKVIFPDLFRNTHFLVLPRWDRYAIANRNTIAGIYNPTVGFGQTQTFLLSKLLNYSAQQLSDLTCITYHPYRSLSLAIVAGTDNRAGCTTFDQHITTYIAQESVGEDFNRQSKLAQDWVTMMGNLLRAAESQTAGGPAPAGMRAFLLDGLYYLSQKLDNVEYMVAIKANYGAV